MQIARFIWAIPDKVNDCDFISALRYTVKGPNSLGSGKAERNIGIKYRGTDPSYIGSIDINVYSSSSPGLNGLTKWLM